MHVVQHEFPAQQATGSTFKRDLNPRFWFELRQRPSQDRFGAMLLDGHQQTHDRNAEQSQPAQGPAQCGDVSRHRGGRGNLVLGCGITISVAVSRSGSRLFLICRQIEQAVCKASASHHTDQADKQDRQSQQDSARLAQQFLDGIHDGQHQRFHGTSLAPVLVHLSQNVRPDIQDVESKIYFPFFSPGSIVSFTDALSEINPKALKSLVIGHLSFFRHLDFVIRHFRPSNSVL